MNTESIQEVLKNLKLPELSIKPAKYVPKKKVILIGAACAAVAAAGVAAYFLLKKRRDITLTGGGKAVGIEGSKCQTACVAHR